MGCTRLRPYCCSWLSYLQSCHERQREPRKKGWKRRGGRGREGAVRDRAFPRLSLHWNIENKRRLPHLPAQICRVNGNCHKFECRLKIFSRRLSVLDDNSMKQCIKHSNCSTLHVRGGVYRLHTEILLRFTRDLAYNPTHAFMVYYTIGVSRVQYLCIGVCVCV